MRTNRKTEEKKMSMSKNIARLAITAGLTAALSFGGVMAPVTMAFAAEGATATTNSITINKYSNNGIANGNVKYKAYRIFKADVVDGKDGSGKVVSNIDWASTEAQNAVLGYLSTVPGSGIGAGSSAQDAAKYLTDHADGTGEMISIKNSNLFNGLAKKVVESVDQTGSSFAAGNVFTPQDKDGNALQGYYLFVTDGNTLSTPEKAKKNTGTSPIFAVVGDALVTVDEKTSIPTVEKKIKNDDGSDWADKADSQMGQNVHYQLTGTVADNVDTFATYYYEFYDELSAGLTADTSSVEVTVYANNSDTRGTKIELPTDAVAYDQTGGKNLLTVKFNDLKTVTARDSNTPVEITASSKVVVTYTASLDPTKAVTVGGQGNPNRVKLIYSNNPMVDGLGESVPDTVRDYTYALKLIKEDSADAKKLKDVGFTIQATTPDEGVAQGADAQYVQKNGSLGNAPYEFTTNDQGEIFVKGLDAGTYTVKETHTLDGYNTLPGFTFTISTVNEDGIDGLGKVEGQNDLTVFVGKPNMDLVETPDVNNGTVTLTVKNEKGSGLPLTGLNGVTFTWIAGGAVLCIGVAHLIRSRKQAEESEQE